MLIKNEIINLDITDTAHDGSGVGRYNGIAVFVPMAAPGDKISARIVKVLKNMCYGIIHEILEPSPMRTENGCPYYKRCGGCSLRHISYESESRIKSKWVTDNLKKIAGIEIPPEKFIPSYNINRYRNKVQLPLTVNGGKIAPGFFAKRSHDIIPVEDCLLQPVIFSEIINTVCSFLNRHKVTVYDEKSHTGLLRHIYLRQGEKTGEIMLCLVINGEDLKNSGEIAAAVTGKFPQVKTICLNINKKRTNVILGSITKPIYGDGYIHDIICGNKVRISPLSFYQINRSSAENVYKKAIELAEISGDDILLDLYCGAGTIGLSMARYAKKVIGIEIIKEAVEDARYNAVLNGITNAEFACMDAAKAGEYFKASAEKPNKVIVDPPRKGLDISAIEFITGINPEKIIYISCNSATLARDARLMEERGYKAQKLIIADFFPRTAHVESLMVFSSK